MLVAVTGGVGAGKSTVVNLLATTLGGEQFSADLWCRELLEPGQAGYLQFIERFGDRYLEAGGRAIDRRALRRALFADQVVRHDLEAILHPLVRDRVIALTKELASGAVAVVEVPLLFECGWEGDFDFIVCVDTPQGDAAARVARRDQVDISDAYRIMTAQMASEEKRRRSDWVIDNGNEADSLESQVTNLAVMLRRTGGKKRNPRSGAKKLDTPNESTYKG